MRSLQTYRNIIRYILLCLSILSCLLCATAQSYSAEAYTVLDEKTFYFMLQESNIIARAEFYSLDLTRSWNATKAPVQSLPALRSDDTNTQNAPLIVSSDKKSLTYLDSNKSPSLYNIANQTWQEGTLLNKKDPRLLPESLYSNRVAIDPSTGTAYIPTWYVSGQNYPIYTYNTFQGYTGNATKIFIAGVLETFIEYRAVWSTVRKSVLFYGVRGENTPRADIMEYQPSTNKWINQTAQGATYPGGSSDPCMASAYNGTKIVMYGSFDAPNSIHILDAKTLVWTKGAASKPGYDRNNAACAVAGDYYIVAGGTLTSTNKQRVLVYNIRLNQWTDSYEALQTPTASTGMETASPVAEQGQPSTEGTPSGARIGIIAGASSVLVFLLICGVFLIRRRKMRRPSQADVIDEDLLKANLGRTEKARNNPNYPAYPGEDMNKSTLESSKNPQEQPMIQNEAFREAPSPSPDGHSRIQGARSPQNHSSKAPSPSLGGLLRSQAARNPQHHSSSIPAVAIKQWQCTQQEQNLQYIPTPPSIPIIPALVHYPRRDLQDHHSGYHDRSDSQDDRHHHNQTEDYNATHYDRHADDPQAYYGDHNEDEDYLATYQDSRMNAPQEHGYSSSENGHSFSNIQRRPDPQDHTRHSAASRLEFYQSRRLNNPQDHGDHGYQVDQDDDALYQEIQRIRAQQEEHMLQEQNLERVRLEKEAKLHTRAGCVKYNLPQGQH